MISEDYHQRDCDVAGDLWITYEFYLVFLKDRGTISAAFAQKLVPRALDRFGAKKKGSPQEGAASRQSLSRGWWVGVEGGVTQLNAFGIKEWSPMPRLS